jgi:hypothetical protein
MTQVPFLGDSAYHLCLSKEDLWIVSSGDYLGHN